MARDARKLSCPEANAGWTFGVPPSVPSFSLLYLNKRHVISKASCSIDCFEAAENTSIERSDMLLLTGQYLQET